MKKINHKAIRINKPIPPELKQAIEAKEEHRRKRKQELIRKVQSGVINFTEVKKIIDD